MLDILGHETVLSVTIAGVTASNIGISEKVPDLVKRLELWELHLQNLLNRITILIPSFDLCGRSERQRHESLQL